MAIHIDSCMVSRRTFHHLRQILAASGGLLAETARRRARRVAVSASRLRHGYRPAYIPLYVMAGIVGIAVVLLVMTAWLRVVVPLRKPF